MLGSHLAADVFVFVVCAGDSFAQVSNPLFFFLPALHCVSSNLGSIGLTSLALLFLFVFVRNWAHALFFFI